jgi:hypothetical protein
MLKQLRVGRVYGEASLVRLFGGDNVLLQLVHLADVEEALLLQLSGRRRLQDRLHALELLKAKTRENYLHRLRVLALLLVDHAELQENLLPLFEMRIHLEYHIVCFLGVVEAAAALVQHTDAKPKLRILLLQSSGGPNRILTFDC